MDLDVQKQIWNKFIDAQEQIIKLRSVPISIIPEESKIVGDKLFLTANQNHKKEIFTESLCEVFKLDAKSFSLDKGYFIQNSEITSLISEHERQALSEFASKSYIKFNPDPVIDGVIIKKQAPFEQLCNHLNSEGIDYSVDKSGKIQIGIADLKKVERKIKNIDDASLNIPESAGIILKIRPNPVYFLQKIFNHVSFRYNPVARWRNIEVINSFFSDKQLEYLHEEYGLKLMSYDFIFKLNEFAVSIMPDNNSPYVLPEFDKENSSYIFRTNVTGQQSDDELQTSLRLGYNEERYDFDLKFKRIKNFFDKHFGSENYSFESRFIYSFDHKKFYQNDFVLNYNSDEFWTNVLNYFSESEDIAFSDSSSTIGLDFKWKEKGIESAIEEKLKVCPIIDVIFLKEDHKCKIDFGFNNISIDEIEINIKKLFPSIDIKRDEKLGKLVFRQFYNDPEQAFRIRDILNSELNKLDNHVLSFYLNDIPNGCEKYICEENFELKLEEESSTLRQLRGSNFNVQAKEFGSLFRVKYPELVFNLIDESKTYIKTLFEQGKVDTITPNLTGDIEKINRLKQTTQNIIQGKGLRNPNLQNFIFDSSKAEPIKEIDYHINSNSETFKELNEHLLNGRSNDSQKQAIIKTLLAKDLSVIQGPPGTGKSTAIAEIIWQHIRLSNSRNNDKERILLTSETNLAVDNAIDRIVNKTHNLVKPIRIADEDKLEMEGRQFSLSVMKDWVDGKQNDNSNCSEVEDEGDSLPQKLILVNWLENIERRAFLSSSIDYKGDVKSLWSNLLKNPDLEFRNNVLTCYKKYCNVIGATCSSIGKYNKVLSDMLTEENGKTIKIPTGFYKQYCEAFGKKTEYINKAGERKVKYEEVELCFTTVIQDETSKATPAELSLPLVYGKKAILIGDHRQLPPLLDREEFISTLEFVDKQTTIKEEKTKVRKLLSYLKRNFKEIEVSHFERLFENIDASLKGVFNLQYRMHPDINDVIQQFYKEDGGLRCGLITPNDLGVNDPDIMNPASRFHGIEIDNLVSENNHVIWIDTNTPEILDGTSRINPGEIKAIDWVLTEFEKSESFANYQNLWSNPEDKQIGLISFYGKQIKLLRDLRRKHQTIPLRVSTVDRFQGMERNIIIVSMVRSNRLASDKNQQPDYEIFGKNGYPLQTDLGFAKSPNRLNVALSRARRLLIIVGNSELYSQNHIYRNVFETINENPNGRIINYPAQ